MNLSDERFAELRESITLKGEIALKDASIELIHAEWEGGMFFDAAGGLTEDERERLTAVERELSDRQKKLFANDHYPIVSGADRYGAFVMFGSFRSAMPSRDVADKIVQVLAESDIYPTPGNVSAEMQKRYSKGSQS